MTCASSQNIDPYYLSQMVQGERLTVTPTTVSGTLRRIPIAGTVVVTVGVDFPSPHGGVLQGTIILHVVFGVNGEAEQLLMGDYAILVDTKLTKQDGPKIEIKLLQGEFVPEATATADYEYSLTA